MQLCKTQAQFLRQGQPLAPGVPLWKVVPTRDEEGRPVSDFMMIIPGLAQQSPLIIDATLQRVQRVLGRYQEVVFANFNLRLNLLWVSVRNKPGITLEVAAAIKVRVPEALLVAPKLER
ncbi:MAG: hypothetical protein ACOY4L_10060 [Pseudomonadota bacterium]